MLCLSQPDLDLHGFIVPDDLQVDRIAGVECEQGVDVGVGLIQSDIANLCNDIPSLQPGFAGGTVWRYPGTIHTPFGC